MGFQCKGCGQWHDDVPLAFHMAAPVGWSDDHAGRPGYELTSDLCVIGGNEFYINGRIEIPIRDSDDSFVWGAWSSLSRPDFELVLDAWDENGREDRTPPLSGWLSNNLPTYEPRTAALAMQVHTRPVGQRPRLEVAAADHPLAVEQREGITWADAIRRVEHLIHAGDGIAQRY